MASLIFLKGLCGMYGFKYSLYHLQGHFQTGLQTYLNENPTLYCDIKVQYDYWKQPFQVTEHKV